MFTKGQKVSQIVPAPIVGEVVGFSVDQETGTVQIKVEWSDADGGKHERFFAEGEVRAVE